MVLGPPQPVALPKGTRIDCVAHFDNSPANRSNPDPTTRVLSLDVFRGLVIVVMTFVNYLSPVGSR